MTIGRKTIVPALNRANVSNPADVQKLLNGLYTTAQIREGRLGSELDQNVTKRDLYEAGLIQILDGGIFASFPGTNDTGMNPVPSGGGPPDLTIPPTPTGLTASGTIGVILLSWTDPRTLYSNHSQTEVWRSNTNDIGAAVMIGTSESRFYNDNIGQNGVTKYYWIRFNSATSVTGPYNATGGTSATTSLSPGWILTELTGQIQATHLYSTLNDRINLIDAASSVSGSVAARILQEANDRGAAITVETTARQLADSSLAQSIALVTASTSGSFDVKNIWYYDTTVEGWTSAGATQAFNAGWIDQTSTGTNPQLISPTGFSILGSQYSNIKARIKRLAGTTGWTGRAYYTTAGHGFSASYYKSVTVPSPFAIGDIATIDFDMSDLTVGGTDWTGGTITQIRLDLGADATDVIAIDWVGIGRSAPGASVASVAALQVDIIARTDSSSAIVTSATALAVRVTNTEALNSSHATYITNLETRASSIEGVNTAQASSITLLKAETSSLFDPFVTWNFETTVEGWTVTGATQAWATGGKVEVTSTTTDPTFESPSAQAIVGSLYQIVKVRIKRLAGADWDGRVYYATSGHGFSNSYYKSIPSPVPFAIGDTATIEFDMDVLTAGGTDWATSTITQIRLDFGSTATDVFSVDWVSVGRHTPSASARAFDTLDAVVKHGVTGLSATVSRVGFIEASLQTTSPVGTVAQSIITAQGTATSAATLANGKNATFAQDTTPTATKIGDTWINTADGFKLYTWSGTAWDYSGDARIATSAEQTTQLTSRLNNATGAASAITLEQKLTTDADSITGLSAQYTVKLDGNGVVSGFGLSLVGGTPTAAGTPGPLVSDFYVAADRFSVGPPSPKWTSGVFKTATTADPYTFVRPVVANKFIYLCITSGNTGPTEPSWPTNVDDEITETLAVAPQARWRCVNAIPFVVGSVGGKPAVIIDTAYIGDATITSAKIGTITAAQVTAGTFSGFSFESGTIAATTIIAYHIRTSVADSGPRLVMNSGGLSGYNAAGFRSLFFDAANASINGYRPSDGVRTFHFDGATGNLTATNVNLTGAITATSGSFAGSLSAATGTFAGSLSAATGTFAGSLSAATGTFAGSLSAVGGTFTGSLSAATGSFAGSLSAATGTFAGSLSAVGGTFTGSLSAATGSFTGTISASTITGGTIDGTTITGGLIRTSAGAKRIELSGTNNEAYFYGNAGGGDELLASIGIATAGADSVIGLFGTTTAGNNKIGLYGRSNSSVGVYGLSLSGGGVYGFSTSGIGVFGFSTSGSGVYGLSTSGNGVYGSSTSGIGVGGFSTSNYGGVFTGNATKSALKLTSTTVFPSSPQQGDIIYYGGGTIFDKGFFGYAYDIDGNIGWKKLHY